MNEEEVHARFVQAVQAAGGTRGYARKTGLTPSYISDIIHKRRLLSDRILQELGVERVVTVTYQEKSAHGGAPDES